MFGASTGSTGLFGNTQSKPAFGAPATNTGSSFLFGNTANQQNTTQNANPSSSFSFGGNNSTSAFGKSASAGSTPNLFGQNSTFGASTGQAQTQTQPQTGGLFGNSNTASSGGLFGKPAASGGLFGGNATQNNAQSTQSGGLFGSTPAPAAPSGGLFGNSSAAPATGGLFAKPAAAPAAGSLFGQQNAQPQQTTLGGLFGAKPASGGLFGASAPAPAPLGGLFGATNTSNTSTTSNGLFSGNTNNAQPSFSWSQNQQPPSNVLNLPALNQDATKSSASTYTPAINDQLIKLKEQWDPNSPKCALKSHVYNKFSDQEMAVLMQQPRPANESPEDWEKAMADRPLANYYPVKMTSFTDVAQRIEVQLDHVARSRVLLQSINEQLSQLAAKHDLDNTTRILKAKVRHTKLARRLLRLATILAILKLKGYPLLPEEEEILKQLQALNAKFSDPNGAVGKLSDLYARLAILKGRSEDLSSQMSSLHALNGDDVQGEDTAQVDHVVDQLTRLLYKQQVGLGYLNEVVQKDMEIVDKATKASS